MVLGKIHLIMLHKARKECVSSFKPSSEKIPVNFLENSAVHLLSLLGPRAPGAMWAAPDTPANSPLFIHNMDVQFPLSVMALDSNSAPHAAPPPGRRQELGARRGSRTLATVAAGVMEGAAVR